jgi:hypothetical protein
VGRVSDFFLLSGLEVLGFFGLVGSLRINLELLSVRRFD